MIRGRTGVSVFLAAIVCLAGVVWAVNDFRTTAGAQQEVARGPRVAAAQRLESPAAAPMPSATVDLVIDFNDFPRGYYSATEDGDAFNPFTVLSTPLGNVTVFGLNTRSTIGGQNAAVIFDTADPTGGDVDIGSPNETCDPPGPGVSADGTGEVGGAWENCPDPELEKGLIVATELTDSDDDDLIDDPNDEGTPSYNPQLTLDFSDIGPVTLVEMAILDKEEGPATVQMFDADGNLVGFVGDIVTGDNGLDPARSLGPTAGVTRMEIVLNGSGLIDNIRFQVEEPEPCIDIRKQAEDMDTRVFPSGSDVEFEIEVSNCGDVELDEVVVTDALVLDCETTVGELAVGESFTYTCTALGVTQSFINEACVDGMGDGTPVDDCDPSTVEIIDIDIRKQAEGPDSRPFPPGADVTFDIVVTNVGPEDLEGVVVTDVLVPDCDRNIGSLAAGDSFAYTCIAPDVTQSFTNEACVTGERGGVTVGHCDPSTVVVEPLLGKIGDFVWWDENADGIQDPGEPGIPGVGMKLLDGNGGLLAETTTNADGLYLFEGLVAGTYSVMVDVDTLPVCCVCPDNGVEGDDDDDDDDDGRPIRVFHGGDDDDDDDDDDDNDGDRVSLCRDCPNGRPFFRGKTRLGGAYATSKARSGVVLWGDDDDDDDDDDDGRDKVCEIFGYDPFARRASFPMSTPMWGDDDDDDDDDDDGSGLRFCSTTGSYTLVQTYDLDGLDTPHMATLDLGPGEMRLDVDFGYACFRPEGCTPGYWKQDQHFDSWVGYEPHDLFQDVFGVPYLETLISALGAGGGHEVALGRHAVAALLNASNPDVSYPLTVAEIIALVQDAWVSVKFEDAKDILEEHNEEGPCPLN